MNKFVWFLFLNKFNYFLFSAELDSLWYAVIPENEIYVESVLSWFFSFEY